MYYVEIFFDFFSFVPTGLILVAVSMCYQTIVQWKTLGVAVLCVKNKCEETFARRSTKSSRISKGARCEIAVHSDNCVHLKQTTALLVCYYYFIILLVIFNTSGVDPFIMWYVGVQ